MIKTIVELAKLSKNAIDYAKYFVQIVLQFVYNKNLKILCHYLFSLIPFILAIMENCQWCK